MVKAILYNRLSTSGTFVGEAEDEISFYKTQNALLTEKLLTLSSLTNIVKKAKEQGFVSEDKSFIVLKTSKSLAVRP